MLMLKLQRTGKKHQASFRLVVGEKRHKLVGEQTEYLGWYNPGQDKYEFNKERIQHWLKVGAQPTDTVHNLLVSAGIIQGKKIAVHKQPKKTEEIKKSETKIVESGSATPATAEKSIA